MKSIFKLFFISAIMSIAMFTSCKDESDDKNDSLEIDKTQMDVLSEGGITLISVATGQSWNASVDVDWVNLEPASGSGSGTVTVRIDSLAKGARRTGVISFTAGSTVKTAHITQRGNLEKDYYVAGDILRLHRHTVGDGVAIVIIIDGFDREDCKVGGVVEYNCKRLCNLFLSMPIIRDYKPYFDVSARIDISRDRGARNCVETPENCPRNNYGVGHADCDWTKIHENAALTAGKDDYSTIFMANGMIGGHVIFNVAVYSANEPNKHYWMMHEFAGHVVGQFPDLYYLGEKGLMDDNTKEWFDVMHDQGTHLMFDWRSDPRSVYWSYFIGKKGYENVGVYKAGLNIPPLAFGQLFVCEDVGTDVMYGPTAHYSVMERYQLWRNIQLRAGFTTITFEEFMEYDRVNIVDADWSWDRYDNWTDDRIWEWDD
jgi:hypothetical protein